MATTVAIPSTTAAATAAADIVVASGASIQVWTTPRLNDGGYVEVFKVSSGGDEEQLYIGGKRVLVTNSDTAMLLNGPAIFRFKKPSTSVPVAVLVDE